MPDPLTIPLPRPWTAGPLVVGEGNPAMVYAGGETDDDRGYRVADCSTSPSTRAYGHRDDEAAANAHLIAAAPELFEALVGLLSDEHRDDVELIRLASARVGRVSDAQIADAIARIDQREQAGRDALRKALGQEAKGA